MSAPPNPMTVCSSWDLVASDYQVDVEPQFVRFATRALELADVKHADRVIDVACGPGTLAFEACGRGASVCALDFSSAMIQCLDERARRECKSIESVVGNGMELPWPDRTFDAGFSMFGLMFFPDRHKGFSELARVLKPNGVAVISSWVPVSRVPIMADIYKTLAEIVPGLPFGEVRSPLSSTEDCECEMSAAGFRDVRVHECILEFDVDGLASFWASMQRSTPPVRLVAEKIGKELWPAIAKHVLDTVTARWGSGPQKIPMTAYLTVGRR